MPTDPGSKDIIFQKIDSISSYFATNMDLLNTDIREQLARGIEYSSYSYVRLAFPTPVKDDSVCILYQGDMYLVPEDEELPIEYIELTSQFDAAQTSVDVEVCEEVDGTILYLDYAASLYKKETIEGYGALMIEMATNLVRTQDVTQVRTKDFIGCWTGREKNENQYF